MNLRSVFAMLAVVVATVLQAQTFYAPNGIGSPANRLTTFTAANPAGWTSIGTMVPDNRLFSGMDFAGVGGNLFAWSSASAANTGLYSVNIATGAATRIGGDTASIQDISWNPVTGQMIGIVSASSSTPASLVSIDLASGSTTSIGTITGLGAALAVGLAHDASGNAYVLDLVGNSVHKLNGLASASTIALGRDVNFSQGMVIDWSGNGNLYISAIGNSPSFFSELLSVDLSTNTVTSLGNFGTPAGTFPTMNAGDIAIVPVPEPATMTALGLGLAAMMRRRRNNRS